MPRIPRKIPKVPKGIWGHILHGLGHASATIKAGAKQASAQMEVTPKKAKFLKKILGAGGEGLKAGAVAAIKYPWGKAAIKGSPRVAGKVILSEVQHGMKRAMASPRKRKAMAPTEFSKLGSPQAMEDYLRNAELEHSFGKEGAKRLGPERVAKFFRHRLYKRAGVFALTGAAAGGQAAVVGAESRRTHVEGQVGDTKVGAGQRLDLTRSEKYGFGARSDTGFRIHRPSGAGVGARIGVGFGHAKGVGTSHTATLAGHVSTPAFHPAPKKYPKVKVPQIKLGGQWTQERPFDAKRRTKRVEKIQRTVTGTLHPRRPDDYL